MVKKNGVLLLAALCLVLALLPIRALAESSADEEPSLIRIVTQEPMPVVPPTLEDLPEEDVPLADSPNTGDPAIALALMAALSGGGMLMLVSRKKD